MSETEEEHVARAIYESMGYLYASRGPYGRWAEALDASRAAIAAVREHEARGDEAMLEEMARAIALANDEQIDWDYCRSVPDHPLVDRAMRQARAAKSVGELKYTESWPEGQTLRAQEGTRRSVPAGNANLQAEIERLTKANKQLTVDLESTRGEIARHTAMFRQKEAECERLQLAAAPTAVKGSRR